MQFGDILASPLIWVLTGICIVACTYAKRSLVAGIITGVIAPMVLIPIWVIAALAINVPHLLLRTLFPEIFTGLHNSSSVWAEAVLFITDPSYLAMFVTAVLFTWYCRVERKTAHLAAASSAGGARGRCSNILRRETWR